MHRWDSDGPRPKRGGRRGRGGRGWRRDNDDHSNRGGRGRRDNDDHSTSGVRGGGGGHPKHLRGRDIGMFYAQRSKSQRTEERKKPLASVVLSETKRQHIRQLLASNTLKKLFVTDQYSYSHVEDSRFKREFLRVINESIEDKLNGESTSIKPDPVLDEKLYQRHVLKQSDHKYLQMLKKREKLPSFSMKKEILQLIEDNQVVVISGETGCGKTTQVAQFILDDYIENKKGSVCKIMCTQPRRISAISVAERVADERAEGLRGSVGYQIRLENQFPQEKGSILFCTTGIVLKTMETDPSLSTVSHLILDEIHERDILSDFILALIKQVMVKRRDLKIILMSATLNSEKFSRYYNDAPHLNIPGFTYPVQEYYLEDVLLRTGFVFDPPQRGRGGVGEQAAVEFSGYIEPYIRHLDTSQLYPQSVTCQLRNPNSEQLNVKLVLALIMDICQKEREDGAILVFLTGFSEISKLIQLMEQSGCFPSNKYSIYPLHSLMPTINQKQIFETPPRGVRKIIVSTNIAETSITVDDVVYVIDCGKAKISNFDVKTNSKTLEPRWVSLANASQRKGRAGRVKPGVCFHLYTKGREMLLEQYQTPEILRSRLEDVILTAKVLQLGRIQPFFNKLIDSPDPEAVTLALDLLKQLNALTDDETLTPLGYHLAKLPISPQMGKMILFGAIFSCLDPILSVATTLDFKDAFQMPIGKEKEVDQKRMQLANGVKSDHLLFHEALNGYEESGSDYRQYCWEYFLSPHTLKLLKDMKRQFMGYLHEMNFVPNSDPKSPECNRNSDNQSLVKAIIAAGLYPNVLIARTKGKPAVFTPDGNRLTMHPKSILSKSYFDASLIVYYNRVRSGSDFVHDGTLIHPLPVIFFGDNYREDIEDGQNVIMINKNLKFKCKEDTCAIIKDLRDRFNWFLEHKISHPGPIDWGERDDITQVLGVIVELITCEDMGYVEDDFDDYINNI